MHTAGPGVRHCCGSRGGILGALLLPPLLLRSQHDGAVSVILLLLPVVVPQIPKIPARHFHWLHGCCYNNVHLRCYEVVVVVMAKY